MNTPVSRILLSRDGFRYVREVDVGRNIGIDKFTGQPTSIMTVMTNARGDLVTATPGLIR